MSLKQLFATKSLEMLDAEAKGENRLRRVLGPVGLTSLGVGAIIGAGIFVMTGEVAANSAGPGILVSYLIAGFACALAAFCYSEFAAMAPVAGSAYTYAYATLGELFAWIIGWDLVLEYAMSAATVASAWSEYFNKFIHSSSEFLGVTVDLRVPWWLCNDPFSRPGAWFNLPAVIILGLCTFVLVIGIRESAISNTIMVLVKLGVVIFVICFGIGFVSSKNWTDLPPEGRRLPEQQMLPDITHHHAKLEAELLAFGQKWAAEFDEKFEVKGVTVAGKAGNKNLDGVVPQPDKAAEDLEKRFQQVEKFTLATFLLQNAKESGNKELLDKITAKYEKDLPDNPKDKEIAAALVKIAQKKEKKQELAQRNWGLLAQLGFHEKLESWDNATRSNFMPYGISGVIFGASIVFFAFIGFDSISTHSEEAINPQRDLPIGILTSLVLCSILYVGVSAVITGMVPYPEIDTKAAVAAAFSDRAKDSGGILNAASALIALGGLAGMTSVLLITFLSQARIFLAMARDGLLPHAVFGTVHEKYKTPHVSTILTGVVIMAVAAFTPIRALGEMVNIGTLFAFVVVCAAVLILRIKRPEAKRPFRCPALFLVAPIGIAANLILMLFLPLETWTRLVVWLGLGLVFYFTFGYRHSVMKRHAMHS